MVTNRVSRRSGRRTASRLLGIITGSLCGTAILLSFSVAAEELKNLGESNRRPCTNTVSLIIDTETQWTRSLAELRELDTLVNFSEGLHTGKQGIPLVVLLRAAENVQAVEVSTCTGKLRRFDAVELEQKQDNLYFIITNYWGLKLHNAAGGENKKQGSRLKGIDRIRLITQPG